MCAILAVINYPFKLDNCITSLNAMTHRGPDKQKYFANSNVFLGHNRLSILDLNPRSDQPFFDDDFIMIYNGEVYNYEQLIIDHALDVKTKSDTEVVLAMYKKFGEACLGYFNGMFAFVIYNQRTGDVFVARDRLGIKPLYYFNSADNWIISSEISSIISLKDCSFDEFGIRQYKKLRMTIKGYTIYKEIKMFHPGHFMINGKIKQYWNLYVTKKEPPNDEEFRSLLEDSVKLRKRSDVDIGSYLSGGLDSTILTAMLRPRNTWTVGFEELNEFNWADLASRNLKTIHHKTIVNIKLFLETAEWMIAKRREPLSVPNEILIYLMTKNVKKENTVILSGEGADELLYGYDRIFKWAYKANEIQLKLFDEKYCYGTHKDDEVLDFALEGIRGNTVLDKIEYFFQIHHLHGLLRRLDNSTMLCSVEARVPFVDHRLVELISGAPFEWRMGKTFKEPLKRVFSNLIPKKIIDRKKVGFPAPLDLIFNDYKSTDLTPMDSWLNFNMSKLGIA